MKWSEEPYVASVEVLVTMSDGSAHSLSTTEKSIMNGCSFGFERGSLPDFGWTLTRSLAPPPIVELSVTIDGRDIRYIYQHHPAPEEES